MEFKFNTVYDREALCAMSKGLRKTIRKKSDLYLKIISLIVIAVAILITIPWKGTFEPDMPMFITWAAAIVLFVTMVFEDKINGYFAAKKAIKGSSTVSSTFMESGYETAGELGTTAWKYENMAEIAEVRDYFVVAFDKFHAQAYDKRTIEGGTSEEFREFLRTKTGKDIKLVS